MRILITGGAGFIGHNVAAQFESLGHDVHIVDSFTGYGLIERTELNALHKERLSQLKTNQVYHDDICSSCIAGIFDLVKPDIVVHCAAYPRAKVIDNNPYYGTQVLTTGLINLLTHSERLKVKKFVYISSSMVYGDCSGLVKEDTACNPKGTYSILKLTGELLTKDWCERANIDYTILRPSAVYGPRDMADRVVSKFFLAAMNNGVLEVRGKDQILDFTYVDDVVNGIVTASLSTNTSRKTYNITHSDGRTLYEAAEMIVTLVGRGNILVTNPDPRQPSRGTFDNSSAFNDFGYLSKVDISEGFKNYFDWLVGSMY